MQANVEPLNDIDFFLSMVPFFSALDIRYFFSSKFLNDYIQSHVKVNSPIFREILSVIKVRIGVCIYR